MTIDREKAAEIIERIKREHFGGNVSTGTPLSQLTWYRIGGPAMILAEPSNVHDLIIIRKFASEFSLPVLVMGGGANLLVSDEGFLGVVIRLAGDFEKFEVHETEPSIEIQTGAAVPLQKIVLHAARLGMAGIERLAGIPGSVGGAIFMNAGTFGEHIDGLLNTVTALNEKNETVVLQTSECAFSYRTSRFQTSGEIILSCSLISEPKEPSIILQDIEARLERRKHTQPVDIPSCGCVFRNPEGEVSAAQLIDEAGLKGLRSGDAVISGRHANFFVNEGSALARDILSLMAEARKHVFDKTGIKLEPEVRLAGFDEPVEVILDEWQKRE